MHTTELVVSSSLKAAMLFALIPRIWPAEMSKFLQDITSILQFFGDIVKLVMLLVTANARNILLLLLFHQKKNFSLF